MNNVTTFQLKARAMLCTSLTVLLVACGGGSGTDVAQTDAQATAQTDAQTELLARRYSTWKINNPTWKGDFTTWVANNTATTSPTTTTPSTTTPSTTTPSTTTPSTTTPSTTTPSTTTPSTTTPSTTTPSTTTPTTTIPVAASTKNYYVATTGSDSNPGTQAAPFKTIMKAASVATAGYTVHVADGTYNETVTSNASGTSSAYITFVSDNKWGAKVVSSAGGHSAAWHNNGDYVAILGFDITGGGAVGINHSGSGDIANFNHVHHIPAASCDGYGGTGIGFDQYNLKSGGIADSNLVHDIGPLGTNCFRVQGVYTSIPNVTISNNIIHRVVGYAVTNGHCSYNVKVLNNTMFGNGGTQEGGGVVMTNNTNCSLPSNGNVVANNIIYDNVLGMHEEGVTSADVTTYTNNLVYGNKTNWGVMGNSHVNDINANPQFLNYISTGGGDYHLGSTSPAIGKGLSSYAPATDFSGVTRSSSTTDIGAFKY